MTLATDEETLTRALKDPSFKQTLRQFLATDNHTNLAYLFRTWLFLALVLATAVLFIESRPGLGLHWAWNIPVVLVAVVMIGAGQHQLTGLAHEGSHFLLLRNRVLNELVSDIFCLFPLYSSTHLYRLQHLAHHQFVNDPDRDPDVFQMKASGHWLSFPVSRGRFIRFLTAQAWLPNVFRFMLVRAQFSATGSGASPYYDPAKRPSLVAVRIGMLLVFPAIGCVLAASVFQIPWLALAPVAAIALAWLVYIPLPGRYFAGSRMHPPVGPRVTSGLRVTVVCLIWAALGGVSAATGNPWVPFYYLLLWVAPIFTTFSLFMILRQVVQHGNGGSGWISNTRVFDVNPLLRFAIFPMGMDFHLPHHLFASVPHYRLKELHGFLMNYPEYSRNAVEVHGYFHSPERPQVHPTVVEVLGPEWEPGWQRRHIDDSVLDAVEMDDREKVLAESERLRKEPGPGPQESSTDQ